MCINDNFINAPSFNNIIIVTSKDSPDHYLNKLAEWRSGSVSAAVRATRVHFQDSPQGDNPGQQLYHARAEQLGELGLPGCDEALSGMGGASLTNEVPGVM